MAYIGAEPVPGQNREVDDISSGFNGNATAFTLQVSSVNVSPESANNILINLGGVLQNPGTDYTVAASTLTFTTAPAAGLSFFGLILGAGINTATVADDTIGPSKLIDTAVTAGSYTTADITVDAQGRVTAAANGTIATAEIADQAITNAKVNNSAAIAASKIADFVTGNTNNRVLTATGTANSLNGEANLTFDGNNLLLNSASGNVLFGETTAYNTFENGSTNPKLQVRGTNLNGSCQAWIRATADAGAPKLFIANTRNTSSNGHTIVQSGDELGGLFFTGSDGSQFVNGASIAATVTGTPGADDMPSALVFGTNAGAAATTERMRIDKDGNVGIGTTSPSSILHVVDSGTTAAEFKLENNEGSLSLRTDNNVATYRANQHLFQAVGGSSEYMRINNSGNVGIGTTSPTYTNAIFGGTQRTFHLTGTTAPQLRIQSSTSGQADLLLQAGNSGAIAYIANAASGGDLFFSTNDGSSQGTRFAIKDDGKIGIGTTSPSAKIHADNGGSGNVAFFKHASSGIAVTLTLQNNRATGSTEGEQISFLDDSGTQRGKITNSTSSTSYHTSSDYRLKENEKLISDGIERVKQLKPYKFNWKHIPNKTVDGFFAHEVQNLVEDCVDGVKDKVVTQEDHNKGDYTDKKIGTEIHQMMDHSKMVPLLTAALQESISKIEVLETKVAALEAA